MSLRLLFSTLSSQLSAVLFDRDDDIRAALTAMVAGENLLLLGETGTSKSLLTDLIFGAFDEQDFSILLQPTTTPKEIFGPISAPEYKKGRLVRNTENRLPEAVLAFGDEIWKAESSSLTGLFKALNERTFENGGVNSSIPLRFFVGASNEYPTEDSLRPLYDRFLVRRWVSYIGSRSLMKKMLLAPDPRSVVTVEFKKGDLAKAQNEAAKVDVSGVIDLILDIKAELEAEGIVNSDRRWKKALSMVKASAWLNGRPAASSLDLACLADCLWDHHDDYPKVYGVLSKKVSAVLGKMTSLYDAAIEASDKFKSADPDQDIQTAKNALKTLKSISERAYETVQGSTGDSPEVSIYENITALHKEAESALHKHIFG